MQLYECTVRLNGSLYNEVLLTDVTAAEVIVLRHIHEGPDAGAEAVVNIKPTRIVRRDDAEERQRLQELYGAHVAKNEHLRSLSNILGHPTVPLPQKLPGVAETEKPRRKIDKTAISTEGQPAEIKQEEFA